MHDGVGNIASRGIADRIKGTNCMRNQKMPNGSAIGRQQRSAGTLGIRNGDQFPFVRDSHRNATLQIEGLASMEMYRNAFVPGGCPTENRNGECSSGLSGLRTTTPTQIVQISVVVFFESPLRKDTGGRVLRRRREAKLPIAD